MSNNIKNPHDRSFKAALSDLAVAKSLLENCLPTDIKAQAQWDTLTLQPGTFVDEALAERFTDILYSVKIQNKDSLIFVLLEHQSTPDELMPLRLLEYQVKIWQQYRKEKITKDTALPIIYPIVIYNGKQKPYPFSTNIYDCFDDKILAQKYLFKPFSLIDLTQVSDEELKQYQLAAGLLLLQKHIYDSADKLEAILYRMIEDQIWQTIVKSDSTYFEILLKYLSEAGEVKNYKPFFAALENTIPKNERKRMSTIAQQLRNEGLQQGIRQGIRQGKREGKQEGIQEGMEKTIYEVAVRLFQEGQSLDLITKVTQLSSQELKELQRKFLH